VLLVKNQGYLAALLNELRHSIASCGRKPCLNAIKHAREQRRIYQEYLDISKAKSMVPPATAIIKVSCIRSKYFELTIKKLAEETAELGQEAFSWIALVDSDLVASSKDELEAVCARSGATVHVEQVKTPLHQNPRLRAIIEALSSDGQTCFVRPQRLSRACSEIHVLPSALDVQWHSQVVYTEYLSMKGCDQVHRYAPQIEESYLPGDWSRVFILEPLERTNDNGDDARDNLAALDSVLRTHFGEFTAYPERVLCRGDPAEQQKVVLRFPSTSTLQSRETVDAVLRRSGWRVVDEVADSPLDPELIPSLVLSIGSKVCLLDAQGKRLPTVGLVVDFVEAAAHPGRLWPCVNFKLLETTAKTKRKAIATTDEYTRVVVPEKRVMKAPTGHHIVITQLPLVPSYGISVPNYCNLCWKTLENIVDVTRCVRPYEAVPHAITLNPFQYVDAPQHLRAVLAMTPPGNTVRFTSLLPLPILRRRMPQEGSDSGASVN
jgi:hypothetical protein